MNYLLQQQISMYMLEISISVYLCWKKGRKAGDNPCGLPTTDADFCEYVRDTDFSAHLERRKKRKIILLNYLLQIRVSVSMLALTS